MDADRVLPVVKHGTTTCLVVEGRDELAHLVAARREVEDADFAIHRAHLR